jgi:hypothetical protein
MLYGGDVYPGPLQKRVKLTSSCWIVMMPILATSTLFQKLRGGAGSKRYGMDFFVHVNEKKKICENITVYAPVNGKIHSILL